MPRPALDRSLCSCPRTVGAISLLLCDSRGAFRGRIGFGPYFHLDAMAPTDLSMGYIHISRVNARHKCIHLSVGKCHGYVSATSEQKRDRLS